MRDFLENFPTEEIEIYDEYGKYIANVKGFFGKEYLTITDVSIPIVEGQYIIRKLPNGVNEKYEIINSKYNKGNENVCDFYKLTLKKSTIKNKETKTIINNIYNCEKVNVDSIDNSVNIKLNNSEELILNEIKKILDSIQENNKEKKELFDEMCKNIGKKTFLEKYQLFIASMADHITVLTPFIPFLTSLINK